MGYFDNVPVVGGVEDAAGTAATGTVDTLIADPGNALLGVNADNMGVFEENAAGSKVVQIGTLGLAGEGGIITDLLTPGKGKPGDGPIQRRERRRQRQEQRQDRSEQSGGSSGGFPVSLLAVLGAGAAVVLSVVSS